MSKRASNRRRRNEAMLTVPDLEEGQAVGRILAAQGENIYEVEDADGTTALYTLPKRLRYVTYVKRGSFVFVRGDNTRGPGKLRGDIETVVLPQFLGHVRKQSFWPVRFATDRQQAHADSAGVVVTDAAAVAAGAGAVDTVHPIADASSPSKRANAEASGDDSAEEEGSNDEQWHIGAGNPNRAKWDHFTDEEDSSEEE